MESFTGDRLAAAVALLAVLFLVGRRLPRQRWPLILLVTLAAIVLIVAAERYGFWPRGWRVR